MDFKDTAAEAEFRAEAHAWLEANVPTEAELEGLDYIGRAKLWQKKKYDAGWACIRWPKEHGGRGASATASRRATVSRGERAGLRSDSGVVADRRRLLELGRAAAVVRDRVRGDLGALPPLLLAADRRRRGSGRLAGPS